jgi:hypothetical protein
MKLCKSLGLIFLVSCNLGLAVFSGCGGENCESRAGTFCTEGVAYWANSCGDIEETIGHCECGCDDQHVDCAKCGCQPQCSGKDCGDDGCQGSCGTCELDETCDQDGQCVPCQPDCTDKECGYDDCNSWCGTCASGITCIDNQCIENISCTDIYNCVSFYCYDVECVDECTRNGPPDAQEAFGPLADCLLAECPNLDLFCVIFATSVGGACESQYNACSTCTAECTDRRCGPDGCGGTCGTCADSLTCIDYTCVTCQPDCVDQECGDDGCNGSCGECESYEVCTDGQCQLCEQDCTNRECGPDPVCQTSCGTCDAHEICNSDGLCECVPDCTDKDCGDDGCGDSCGECSATTGCYQDKCVRWSLNESGLTVIDNQERRAWTRTPPAGALTYDDADATCQNLIYDNADDWVFPTASAGYLLTTEPIDGCYRLEIFGGECGQFWSYGDGWLVGSCNFADGSCEGYSEGPNLFYCIRHWDYYADQDGDGYGAGAVVGHYPLSSFQTNNDDCDDNDPKQFPGAQYCDTSGVNNDWDLNCDGGVSCGACLYTDCALDIACPGGQDQLTELYWHGGYEMNCWSAGWVGSIPAYGGSGQFRYPIYCPGQTTDTIETRVRACK